ncbi:MAG: ATP-dependent DNA helicase RecQ [Bradymonadales bacterium]
MTELNDAADDEDAQNGKEKIFATLHREHAISLDVGLRGFTRMTNSENSKQAEALDTLQRVFAIPAFRTGQAEIIDSILREQNTLAVMPTGSGKSLCYQLPAVLSSGLTLVVCPLIALMKDQVDSLQARGIRAAYLHSGVDYAQQQATIHEIETGLTKILFVAPERFRNQNFQSLLKRIPITLLAVDEAHCISQWGHDFRPDYRRIGSLRESLSYPPTIALTATASPEVQRDIITQLDLKTPDIHILGFDRPNLLFKVRMFRTQRQKLDYALEFIRSTLPMRLGSEAPIKGCGLLYASTRKQAEEAVRFLRENGIFAGLYHAGLSDDERSEVQERFMNDDYHVLVATTAFGMGVDKPDIRYVLHLSMSSSIEAYTQESGRAGRDRQASQCILLYTPQDMKIQEFFIDNSYPPEKLYNDICKAFLASDDDPQPAQELSYDALRAKIKQKNKNGIDTALRKLRAIGAIELPSDGSIVMRRLPERKVILELSRESKLQRNAAEKRLKDLLSYIYNEECRTKFILRYFGSREAKNFKKCYHCDLCNVAFPTRSRGEDGPFPPEPLHILLLKILSTVARRNGRINSAQVAATLSGQASPDAIATLSTYSLLSYLPPEEIKVITALLCDAKLLISHCAILGLSAAGSRALKAKSLDDFPPSLAEFLKKRFNLDSSQ